MSIVVTIQQRNAEAEMFAARGPHGYVYGHDKNGFLTRQLFDSRGNALTARTEADLRKVARNWLRRNKHAAA